MLGDREGLLCSGFLEKRTRGCLTCWHRRFFRLHAPIQDKMAVLTYAKAGMDSARPLLATTNRICCACIVLVPFHHVSLLLTFLECFRPVHRLRAIEAALSGSPRSARGVQELVLLLLHPREEAHTLDHPAGPARAHLPPALL
jgi:hypothetical protein